MTKYIIAILCLFPFFAHAETMCVKNDTIMVVLDPEIGGGTGTYNSSAQTWSVSFGYGTISGLGWCDNAKTNNINPSNSGIYCHCKMTHPAESKWWYSSKYHGSQCRVNCAQYCADLVSPRSTAGAKFREKLFGSVQ